MLPLNLLFSYACRLYWPIPCKVSHITTAIRTSKSDAATFLVTFSIGIIFSLQMAIFWE